jgi:hypothetical protein
MKQVANFVAQFPIYVQIDVVVALDDTAFAHISQQRSKKQEMWGRFQAFGN